MSSLCSSLLWGLLLSLAAASALPSYNSLIHERDEGYSSTPLPPSEDPFYSVPLRDISLLFPEAFCVFVMHPETFHLSQATALQLTTFYTALPTVDMSHLGLSLPFTYRPRRLYQTKLLSRTNSPITVRTSTPVPVTPSTPLQLPMLAAF